MVWGVWSGSYGLEYQSGEQNNPKLCAGRNGLGTIGVEFLLPFRVVLDSPNSQFGFNEQAGGQGGR